MKYLFLLPILIFASIVSVSAQPQEYESHVIKVGIVTVNPAATLEFYTNVMGMMKVREFDVDSATSRKFGFSRGIPFHVDCFKIENSPDATEIKILGFAKKSVQNKPDNIQSGTGAQFITLYVKSLKPFLKRFKDNNVIVLGESPTPVKILNENPLTSSSTISKQLVLIQDPNGVFIEIVGNN
jgi:catechol 2,3-dioxygenase-like lactoylglutathione lyase family enzyme